MKRLVILGLCTAISLLLVFGSVFSSSPFLPLLNNVFAVDMGGGTMDGGSGDSAEGDNNQGGNSGDGEHDNADDSSNSMPPPEDAPLTTGALTAGEGSDNDDDNPGGSRDDDEDNNEPTSKDAPVSTDAPTAKKLECPKGQEVALFSTSCEPAEANTATSAKPRTDQRIWLWGLGDPPAAALPYNGNELELIYSYHENKIEVIKYDTNGPYGRFTFTDGTIKEGTYGKGYDKGDTVLQDIKIIPGSGTELDRLGVKKARLKTASLPEVHYKDGKIVTIGYDIGDFTIRTIDAKGNLLEITVINGEKTNTYNPNDRSFAQYKEDGSYIKTWPEKADGTQQFYDSKEQKVFVRDADGNIIPPKE